MTLLDDPGEFLEEMVAQSETDGDPSPHLRNWRKKMLMLRLLLPSSRFTSDISFFFFSPLPAASTLPSAEISGALGATRQNRFSMSRKSEEENNYEQPKVLRFGAAYF